MPEHSGLLTDLYELTMDTGHFGLVVGSRASAVSWRSEERRVGKECW